MSLAREAREVLVRRARVDHQRHHARVWSDDELVPEPALEAETGHAERLVLIVEARIGLAVAGLRDAPRHGALAAILDLSRDHGAIGLGEQRALVGRHHE